VNAPSRQREGCIRTCPVCRGQVSGPSNEAGGPVARTARAAELIHLRRPRCAIKLRLVANAPVTEPIRISRVWLANVATSTTIQWIGLDIGFASVRSPICIAVGPP
jgi:hypothetical protein